MAKPMRRWYILAVLTPTQKYPIYIIRDTASSATDHNYFAKNTKASLFHFFTCFISHQHHLISHRIFIILDLCRRRSSLIHSPISLSVISHREYLDSCQYFHSQCRRHQFQPLVLIRHWYHHRIASQIASSVPCFLIVFSLSLLNCYQIVSTARWSFVIDPHWHPFQSFCQSSSSRVFRLASIRLRLINTCESRFYHCFLCPSLSFLATVGKDPSVFILMSNFDLWIFSKMGTIMLLSRFHFYILSAMLPSQCSTNATASMTNMYKCRCVRDEWPLLWMFFLGQSMLRFSWIVLTCIISEWFVSFRKTLSGRRTDIFLFAENTLMYYFRMHHVSHEIS